MPQYGYSGPMFPALSAWLDSPAGTSVAGGADEGVIGGYIIDHAGVLGKPGARVPASAMRAALEGKPPGTYRQYETIPDGGILDTIANLLDGNDPEPPPPPKPEIPKWLYAVVGVAALVGGYTIYKRTQ